MYNDDEIREKHPSYGTLLFNHANCGGSGMSLFNSTLRHNTFISIEIRHAERIRSINRERIFGSGIIVRAEMSNNQFIEAITNMNRGTGTPITLRFISGEGEIQEPEYINERVLIEKEFKNRFEDLSVNASEITKSVLELLDKKAIRKSDIQDALSLLHKLQRDLDSNIPYMTEAAQEMLDKGVTEAKHEVEAAVSLAIHNAGIDAIDGDTNKLLSYMGKEDEVLHTSKHEVDLVRQNCEKLNLGDAKILSDLRDMTGLGKRDCLVLLIKAGGDIEKAYELAKTYGFKHEG